MSTEKTIVAFHIGRGGHFHNPGHLSFIGSKPISDYTDNLFLNYDLSSIMERLEDENEDWQTDDTNYDEKIFLTKRDLFIQLVNEEKFNELEKWFGITENDLGIKEYFDGGGNHVGLTESECESGIGRINIDHDYDTTYTRFLSDCNEKEMQAILDYTGYVDSEIIDYCKETLGIEEEEEEEEEDETAGN